MFHIIRKLKEKGIVSINQRNADYVLKYNDRKKYPIVDNKVLTKQLAQEAGIATPELYALIESEHDIINLEEKLAPYQDYAIKPAHGVGGDGIIVITDRVQDYYRKTNGELLKFPDIAYHVSNILSGMHSLAGHTDKALIEYRVKVDPVFNKISYQGVPDLRIITLLGFPVMAMVRLPTRMSDGKANLHQGAIGVGIELATGKTFGGVWKENPIDFHPDTLNSIEGCQVPYWDDVLVTAASCYELTGLGYIGVDIVLDIDKGPLMLELNARPGLSIQIANRIGLGINLSTVEALENKEKMSPRDRVDFVKDSF